MAVPPGKRICLGVVVLPSEPEERKLLSADGYQLETIVFGACADADLDAVGGVEIEIGDAETLLERKTLSDYKIEDGTALQIVFLPAGSYQ